MTRKLVPTKFKSALRVDVQNLTPLVIAGQEMRG